MRGRSSPASPTTRASQCPSFDPDNLYRFLKVRGTVERIDPDPTAAFYRSLQQRYGNDYEITDADVRVVIVVKATRYIRVNRGEVHHP